uniref:Wsv220-like protein n=1 Tax=Melicertus latisulcatus pemonivirus TaxID=2984278 RepID=A0A9C7C634_9VIRU|nr:MAG: wsv220-like protein [Melicertus latisulcatus pemonivirus]
MTQSNRVSFLINTITRCQRLATRGMGGSGRAIDRSLKGHILAAETLWSQATEKVKTAEEDPGDESNEHHVDLGLLADGPPLNGGRASSQKAEYAHVLVANVTTHLNYLGIAATVIVRDLKRVLLSSRDRGIIERENLSQQREENRGTSPVPVMDCRPHPFGGIQPPSIEEVTQTLGHVVEEMEFETTLDTETIAVALEALDAEHRTFHRENVLNNAFVHAEAESATAREETFNGIFVLSDNYENWQKAALDGYSASGASLSLLSSRHPFVDVHPGVVKRGPNDPTSWRPQKPSPDENFFSSPTAGFPFIGLWGPDGQGVDRETLFDFLGSVVAPHVDLAAAAAIITCHLRRHLECMSSVLFCRATGFDDGLDKCPDLPVGYETWPVWQRLKIMLDWFTLIWRVVIYSHEKIKDALDGNRGELTALAALLESWPPVFFNDEWLFDTFLGQWPGSTRELSDPATVAGLISTAILVPPGYHHPVFGRGVVNNTGISLWHRLSFDSATYLCSAVLGRARREEIAGTFMLVGRHHYKLQSQKHQKYQYRHHHHHRKKQQLPDECDGCDIMTPILLPLKQKSSARGSTSSSGSSETIQNPFLCNPLYRIKIVWTGDTGEHLLIGTDLLNECLTIMEPILQRGHDQKSVEWMTLRLFAIDEIESNVDNLWIKLLRYNASDVTTDDRSLLVKRLLNNARMENDIARNKLGKAVEMLDGGLAEAALGIERDEKTLAAVNERRMGSARAAETALFEVAAWTSAADAIMEAIASFPTFC